MKFFCFFFFFLRSAPTAYGGSQARGWIGAIPASLHHSHSNAGSARYEFWEDIINIQSTIDLMLPNLIARKCLPTSHSFFSWLACGSSKARDWTCAIAVTQATTMTTLNDWGTPYCLFDNSHPDRCEVISHCGFDFQLPYYYWCWIPFHISIGHLYIFCSEISVQVLCPFFNQGICFCCYWVVLSSLYVLDINPLSDNIVCKYTLSFHMLLYHSVGCFFCGAKAF